MERWLHSFRGVSNLKIVHAWSGFRFLSLKVILRYNVDQEIKDLCGLNAVSNIALLQCSSFSVFSMMPCSVGQLNNKDFAGLCE
jgi:hypothetical protein